MPPKIRAQWQPAALQTQEGVPSGRCRPVDPRRAEGPGIRIMEQGLGPAQAVREIHGLRLIGGYNPRSGLHRRSPRQRGPRPKGLVPAGFVRGKGPTSHPQAFFRAHVPPNPWCRPIARVQFSRRTGPSPAISLPARTALNPPTRTRAALSPGMGGTETRWRAQPAGSRSRSWGEFKRHSGHGYAAGGALPAYRQPASTARTRNTISQAFTPRGNSEVRSSACSRRFSEVDGTAEPREPNAGPDEGDHRHPAPASMTRSPFSMLWAVPRFSVEAITADSGQHRSCDDDTERRWPAGRDGAGRYPLRCGGGVGPFAGGRPEQDRESMGRTVWAGVPLPPALAPPRMAVCCLNDRCLPRICLRPPAGSLHVLALGPLTNLALLARDAPEASLAGSGAFIGHGWHIASRANAPAISPNSTCLQPISAGASHGVLAAGCRQRWIPARSVDAASCGDACRSRRLAPLAHRPHPSPPT